MILVHPRRTCLCLACRPFAQAWPDLPMAAIHDLSTPMPCHAPTRPQLARPGALLCPLPSPPQTAPLEHATTLFCATLQDGRLLPYFSTEMWHPDGRRSLPMGIAPSHPFNTKRETKNKNSTPVIPQCTFHCDERDHSLPWPYFLSLHFSLVLSFPVGSHFVLRPGCGPGSSGSCLASLPVDPIHSLHSPPSTPSAL